MRFESAGVDSNPIVFSAGSPSDGEQAAYTGPLKRHKHVNSVPAQSDASSGGESRRSFVSFAEYLEVWLYFRDSRWPFGRDDLPVGESLHTEPVRETTRPLTMARICEPLVVRAAQNLPARHLGAIVVESSSSLAPQEKRYLQATKTLRDILRLEAAACKGAELDTLQARKIARKPEAMAAFIAFEEDLSPDSTLRGKGADVLLALQTLDVAGHDALS